MLAKAPSVTPPLSWMLDDLGRPHPRKLARLLGVSERTVRRWMKDDQAPRAVLYAIYWLTSWGQQAVHAELHNSATMYAGYVACLKSEVESLRHELARVLSLAHFDSANAPSMVDVPRLEPAPRPQLQAVKA